MEGSRFVRAALRQSWPRSSEQDSARVKWTAAGLVGCDIRALGVTEGGRSPTGVTSSARRKSHAAAAMGERVEVSLVGRAPVKARMRAPLIVEGEVAADRGARLADAVVGFQIVE